ncbi:alpha-1,4-glucan--maltose-1-phosphate maltosyltransferase [Pseudonocardiaceae bacterium YIM PH 21723]|nr:alpha-1,4-glucan--maltose-1-phosphate maltosyltransferase [Pseudonocardiaceae bacterium YIM PH 21723]
MSGRLGIDDISPKVSCGRYSAKGVIGEHLPIGATVWREGHDAVAATVVWRGPDDRGPGAGRSTRLVPHGTGKDRWIAHIVPDRDGEWTFRVDAWSDPWATWLHAVEKKTEAGQSAQELANDLEIGARLLTRVARRPNRRDDRPLLDEAAAALRNEQLELFERTAPALSGAIATIMYEHPVRELVTKGTVHKIWVDRQVAGFGSWYELFPRSTGGVDHEGNPVHGTFQTAAQNLDRVAAMGFDVVYLPPIHPVGEINRKGRNNTLTPGPEDVGSPWAIGSRHGGHDAIEPALGTLEEFKGFVDRCHELGMEVALDFALQCAPDHPWVKEHPRWFTQLPDGTIAYAENPPKKYQDIYPLNFDNDPRGLYAECFRVVKHWIEHGVRIFRVDNPHTKPPDFWHWLIWKVKETYPDVLFLSEAFTRPARMYGLSKLGFSQNYTYFTWRTTKAELTEFGESIVEHVDEARPNLFVNTPDILPENLQVCGPPMFAIRAVLAATMAPVWGVYSGYELFENTAVKPGSEEYLDSEKYELRPRNYAQAVAEGRSLEPLITKLNQIRREHPALQQLRTLKFHDVDSDALVVYSKTEPGSGDMVLVVVNLDPDEARDGVVRLDMPELGMNWDDRFVVLDKMTGQTWEWGQSNWVRLEPGNAPCHILSVIRRPNTSRPC